MRRKDMSLERLPDAELEVMLALWRAGRPMKVVELRDALKETHAWQKATIQVLLGRLSDRGFVTAEQERNYRLYRPLVREEEYRASESNELMRKLCRGRVSTLVASLIEADALEADDLDELEAILAADKVNRERGGARMTALFGSILTVSLSCGVIVLILLLCQRPMKRFRPWARYLCWLLLMLRLAIPVTLPLLPHGLELRIPLPASAERAEVLPANRDFVAGGLDTRLPEMLPVLVPNETAPPMHVETGERRDAALSSETRMEDVSTSWKEVETDRNNSADFPGTVGRKTDKIADSSVDVESDMLQSPKVQPVPTAIRGLDFVELAAVIWLVVAVGGLHGSAGAGGVQQSAPGSPGRAAAG